MIKGRYVRGGHYTEVVLNNSFVRGRKGMIPKFIDVNNYIDAIYEELQIVQERWNSTHHEVELREIEALNKAIIIARTQPQIGPSVVRKSCETCRHRRKKWNEEPCASCKFIYDDGTEWESMKGVWKYIGSFEYECSECGCSMNRVSAFCPDCGAPMEVKA